MQTNVDKRDFLFYVSHKIKNVIHYYHIFAVMSILFEEMIRELRQGNAIKIANFGTLLLKNMPARQYYDVRYQKLMETPGHKILRFVLAKPIRKKLCEALDLDKIGK